MALKQVTHIVPVGHTKEKLVDSIRQFPVHRVVLIVGEDLNVSGEDKVYDTAKEIEKELKGFVEIEWRKVDKLDVLNGAIDILKIIKEERASGKEVKINVTGSLRTIGIACYIAALVSNVEIYSALPAYKNGKVIGIKEILKIPFFPIKELPEEQLEILQVLQGNSTSSVDELIARLKPKLRKGTREYANERARLSHHLKILREDGFLESEKAGKNVKLKLSRIGEIYAMGRGYQNEIGQKGYFTKS